jgi:hypothetical protein
MEAAPLSSYLSNWRRNREMRRETKIRIAKTEAWMAEQEAAYARYFRFLDQLKPADGTMGARTDQLAEEFGLTVRGATE